MKVVHEYLGIVLEGMRIVHECVKIVSEGQGKQRNVTMSIQKCNMAMVSAILHCKVAYRQTDNIGCSRRGLAFVLKTKANPDGANLRTHPLTNAHVQLMRRCVCSEIKGKVAIGSSPGANLLTYKGCAVP